MIVTNLGSYGTRLNGSRLISEQIQVSDVHDQRNEVLGQWIARNACAAFLETAMRSAATPHLGSSSSTSHQVARDVRSLFLAWFVSPIEDGTHDVPIHSLVSQLVIAQKSYSLTARDTPLVFPVAKLEDRRVITDSSKGRCQTTPAFLRLYAEFFELYLFDPPLELSLS